MKAVPFNKIKSKQKFRLTRKSATTYARLNKDTVQDVATKTKSGALPDDLIVWLVPQKKKAATKSKPETKKKITSTKAPKKTK